MRAFSIIVACLTGIAGVIPFVIVPRFRAAFEEVGAELPSLTRTVLATSGWLPGAILLLFAVLLAVLLFARQPKASAIMAIPALLALFASAILLPAILLLPLSRAIEQSEQAGSSQAREPGG